MKYTTTVSEKATVKANPLLFNLCALIASWPIAIHYAELPSKMFNVIRATAKQESGMDYEVTSDGLHFGLFQFSSTFFDVNKWLGTPQIISVPRQFKELVKMHLKKPGKGGWRKFLIQHHGLIKWSQYNDGIPDNYVDEVKARLERQKNVPEGVLEGIVIGAIILVFI